MTETLTRSAARVYAALTELGAGSPDVLVRLAPFFAPILRSQEGQRFEAEDFAREIRVTYNWNFNVDIVEMFIPTMKESGWLIPDNAKNPNTTYTIGLPDQAPETDMESSVLIRFREVAEQFKTFAGELPTIKVLPAEVEYYENILIEWLLYTEAFSEYRAEAEVSVDETEAEESQKTLSFPKTTLLGDEEKFLCARFVKHALKTEPDVSEILARTASIGLLIEVVQDFAKPNTPVENANHLAVYLDAPVALDLLGLSGEAARENTRPIIAELQRVNASVRIYSRSVDEIKHTLKAVLESDYPTGLTAQAIKRGEVVDGYVAEVAEDPESFLDGFNVKTVHRSLEDMPNEHTYFGVEQWEYIYSALNFMENHHAREHDSDITTLVMRQRARHKSRDIFKSRFLIVTRNVILAKEVRRACIRMGLLSRNHAPPIIHRRVLTSAVWLRTGLRAENFEVPKRMLLDSCEHVLAFHPGVVGAVVKAIRNLGDKEKARQMQALIRKDKSILMLMDKTLGVPSAVTQDNLTEIFEEMLHPHLEEERRKGDERVEGERERLRAATDAHDEAAHQLNERQGEDRNLIGALCAATEKKLRKHSIIKRVMCTVFAIGAAYVGVDKLAWPWSLLAFFLAAALIYLTVTGVQLVRVSISEEAAMTVLNKIAKSSHLDAKMSRFDISWNGKKFAITDLYDSPADLVGRDDET